MTSVAALFISALIGALGLAGQLRKGGDIRDSAIAIVGNYTNQDLGFSVDVPAGFRGHRLSAPSPNHGFEIHLSDRGSDRIWVNAEYDALMLGSTDLVADEQAAALCRKYDLKILSTTRHQLAGLDARSLILGSSRGDKSVNYVHLIVGFLPRSTQIGIIYQIGLDQKVHTKEAEQVLSAVGASFRVFTLPR